MNRIIVLLSALAVAVGAFCQSIDERVGSAINGNRWSELRQLYIDEGKDLQTSFLHPLSRFFIYHFYNQPDSAIHYGMQLLRQHQAELGGSVSSVVWLTAEDYARKGQYRSAADLLHKLNEATRSAGQSPAFVAAEKQYGIIDSLGGFAVERPDHDVSVPLRFYKDDVSNPVMLSIEAEIGGTKRYVTFDTGAGANLISYEMASAIGARVFDAGSMPVSGFSKVESQFAIVDSIKLGEVTYRNVPFLVVDFSTQNEKANKKMSDLGLNMIIGSQMMMPLGELQFDFEHRRLIVPATQSAKPAFAPNFYYSIERQLRLSVYDKATNAYITANFDTGASDSELSTRYYANNKAMFANAFPTDTLRQAGIGGFEENLAFKHRWQYGVGDANGLCDSVFVKIPSSGAVAAIDATVGLPSIAKHRRMILNFNDMWIKLED